LMVIVIDVLAPRLPVQRTVLGLVSIPPSR
jgi:hypothetical protein